MISSNKLLSA